MHVLQVVGVSERRLARTAGVLPGTSPGRKTMILKKSPNQASGVQSSEPHRLIPFCNNAEDIMTRFSARSCVN